jgi:hypothetical protein
VHITSFRESVFWQWKMKRLLIRAASNTQMLTLWPLAPFFLSSITTLQFQLLGQK